MVVANCSPLIYLARISKIGRVIDEMGPLTVPESVYTEVVLAGKGLRKPESDALERLAEERKVLIGKTARVAKPPRGLHAGEMESIALAKQMDDLLLVDDEVAIRYGEIMNVRCLRTIGVLLLLLSRKRIALSDFTANLERLISSGFWLTADVYAEALREARSL